MIADPSGTPGYTSSAEALCCIGYSLAMVISLLLSFYMIYEIDY